MNRRALIAAAARRSELSIGQMGQALRVILETIEEALAQGDCVTLADFGRFKVQTYPGRRLHRFDGPGHYEAQERVIPVFVSSASLRRRLREGGHGHE